MAPQVVHLGDFAKELVDSTPSADGDHDHLVDIAKDMGDRFRALKQALDAECGKLADTVQQTEELQV